jgi:hypothetical protein
MKYEKGFKGDHGRHALNDPNLKQRKVYERQDRNKCPKSKHDVDIFRKFHAKH